MRHEVILESKSGIWFYWQYGQVYDWGGRERLEQLHPTAGVYTKDYHKLKESKDHASQF